jgi:hypothetical protein
MREEVILPNLSIGVESLVEPHILSGRQPRPPDTLTTEGKKRSTVIEQVSLVRREKGRMD